MSFAPFFANAALPEQVKAGLTLGAHRPVTAGVCIRHAPASGLTGWLEMALSEVALGMIIGFTTQFVFEGMELAGTIVSFQFGFSLVNVIDPNSQVEVTVLSTLHDLDRRADISATRRTPLAAACHGHEFPDDSSGQPRLSTFPGGRLTQNFRRDVAHWRGDSFSDLYSPPCSPT